jgi:hypothetical protein
VNRRRFLAALGLAPVAPKALLAAAPRPVLSGLAAWLPVFAGPAQESFFGIDRTFGPKRLPLSGPVLTSASLIALLKETYDRDVEASVFDQSPMLKLLARRE